MWWMGFVVVGIVFFVCVMRGSVYFSGWDVVGEVGVVCLVGVVVGVDLDLVVVDFVGNLDFCIVGKLVDDLFGW